MTARRKRPRPIRPVQGVTIDVRDPVATNPGTAGAADALTRLAVEIEVLQHELERRGTRSPGIDRLAEVVDSMR